MIVPEKAFHSLGLPTQSLGTEGLLTVQWRIPGDLPYFQGHFPGNPIFPAVGIVDASLTLVQRILKPRKISLHQVNSAKFLNPIVPGNLVQIELTPQEGSTWLIDWKSVETGEEMATLKISFAG